jgi:hypothetical protein
MPSTLLLPLPFRGSELQLRHKPSARQRLRTVARVASLPRRRSRMPLLLPLTLPFRGSELQLRHKPSARQRFRTVARIASLSRRRSRMPLILPLPLTLPFGPDAAHLGGASDGSQRLARESRASGKRLAAPPMSELKLRPPKKRAAFLIDNFKKTRAIRNHIQTKQNNHHDQILIDTFVDPLPPPVDTRDNWKRRLRRRKNRRTGIFGRQVGANSTRDFNSEIRFYAAMISTNSIRGRIPKICPAEEHNQKTRE